MNSKGLHQSQRVGVCILTIEWLINLLVLRVIDNTRQRIKRKIQDNI
jgi:hypothetical protein